LYYGLPTGQVKKSEIPKRAGATDKSISTGIKYWICCFAKIILSDALEFDAMW
jgi:hypothetical protein